MYKLCIEYYLLLAFVKFHFIYAVKLRLCALRSKKTYDYMQSFLEEATTFLSHIIQDFFQNFTVGRVWNDQRSSDYKLRASDKMGRIKYFIRR